MEWRRDSVQPPNRSRRRHIQLPVVPSYPASYYQFPNAQEMNGELDGLVADEQIQPGLCRPDENSAFSGHGTWGDPVIGRFACYMSESNSPWIEWTHDSLALYSFAFAVGDDEQVLKQQLYDSWIDAGPW